MTTRRNELHDIIDALRLEKKSYSEDADKANPIKFGEQRFSSRAAAVKHWEGLPPAKKQEHLQKYGNESIVQMLRGGNGRNA
jgi:hypothetical protein